jgi:hypothetical protein
MCVSVDELIPQEIMKVHEHTVNLRHCVTHPAPKLAHLVLIHAKFALKHGQLVHVDIISHGKPTDVHIVSTSSRNPRGMPIRRAQSYEIVETCAG